MGRYGHPYVDNFSKYCIGTQLKFVFFPRKCHITGRVLWLEYVYKQTALYSGPSDAIFEHRYYDKTEFLVNKIKGEI